MICTGGSARAWSRLRSARQRQLPRHVLSCPVHATQHTADTCTRQAALYAKLQAGVLTRRAAGAHDTESLDLTARLLELNPEVLTAWNFRRDILASLRAGADAAREAELLGASRCMAHASALF